MRQNLNEVLERFEGVMADFIDALRDNLAEAPAGAGEIEEEQAPARAEAGRGGINDNDMITMRSGDLREVIEAYRTLSRMARTGCIPTQDERFKLHQHIKKVKHLLRKPIR